MSAAGHAVPAFPKPDDADGDRDWEQPERAQPLEALAAGVMHEFNNLLTVVLGTLEQLSRQALDERGRKQLDRAEWGVLQAARLAKQTLSVARLRHGEPRRVDLNEVVRELDKLLSHAVGYASGVTVEMALGEQVLPARLDLSQLELALLNLLRNAADATAEGGLIVVRTAGHPIDGLGDQPTVEIAVSDNGTGMTPEVIRHATERLYTTKGTGRGTGLGLWMVQRFMESCGGKLTIEAAPGRGTTVRLVFPRDDGE